MILDFNLNTLKFGSFHQFLHVYVCGCLHVLVYPIGELQIDNRHTNETVHMA